MNLENPPHEGEDVFVIRRTDAGLRIFAARDPASAYLLTGTREEPACTCSDGRSRRCEHIAAAEMLLPAGAQLEREEDSEPQHTRDRTEEEAMANGEEAQVVIKRSVSPDGRIDSLSVEIGFPAGNLSTADIRAKAENAMRLQTDIAQSFLGKAPRRDGGSGARNGNGSGNSDGSVPAEIVGVGGMPGKWGRRLFLNVRSADRMLRLFGNARQLSECLEALGHGSYEGKLAEGLSLGLACRVVTKPSEDGKWVNIDRILPAEKSAGQGNGR